MKKLLLILLCLPMIVFGSFPVLNNKDYNIYQDSCDNIILMNGDEISGKVIEISNDVIKYRKCDYLDGPLISVYKKQVFMVTYRNGSKDIFHKTDKMPAEGGWAPITSFILSLLACIFVVELGVVFGFFAVSFALIGLFPKKKRYYGLAIAGLVAGLICLSVSILIRSNSDSNSK